MREQKQDITDQGWAAMQRILDREMPRRRRRRVAGWWWFAGLLLLLPALGITGWQLYKQADEPVPAPFPPTLPAAPLAERSPVQVPPTDADPGIVNNSVESNTSAKNSRFSGPNAAQPVPVRSQGFLTREDMSLSKIPPAKPLNAVIPESETVAQTVRPAYDISPSDVALAMLPPRTPALDAEEEAFDFKTYPDYVSPDITKKVQHRATWSLGAMAGINSERLPRVNGGVGGLVVDWQPLRHWGLRSGMQYAMQRLAADESLVTAISEESYEKASNGLGVLDASGHYNYIGYFSSINTDILASVRRIHRIETPLLVYWQPARPFRMYAGASLNYTFLAQVSPHILADNQVFKVATGRDELNRLATEKLNRWQVKWQLGLGYRIGRRVEINAGIQAALPKISLRKDNHLDGELQMTAERNSISIEQVRQLGVTLRGVYFF